MWFLRWGRRGFFWWAAWGLVEFYFEYPAGGYDGGFVGDLVLFGTFLALGQAPFVAAFVWALLRATGARSWRGGLAAMGVLVGWSLAGIFGWALGSFFEVSISESLPLYFALNVLAGAVRWVVLGGVEGFVLAVAVAVAPEAGRATGRGGWRSSVRPCWRGSR